MAKGKLIEKQSLSPMLVEEFAIEILGIDEESETNEVENQLYEKYGCDLDQFTELMQLLYQRLHLSVSPLTETPFIGFSHNDQMWSSVKKETMGAFLDAVLEFMGASKLEVNKGGNERPIIGDKTEYLITLKRIK